MGEGDSESTAPPVNVRRTPIPAALNLLRRVNERSRVLDFQRKRTPPTLATRNHRLLCWHLHVDTGPDCDTHLTYPEVVQCCGDGAYSCRNNLDVPQKPGAVTGRVLLLK